jgi:hypothetical protein
MMELKEFLDAVLALYLQKIVLGTGLAALLMINAISVWPYM